MHEIWKEWFPYDNLSERALINKKNAIIENKLLSSEEAKSIMEAPVEFSEKSILYGKGKKSLRWHLLE